MKDREIVAIIDKYLTSAIYEAYSIEGGACSPLIHYIEQAYREAKDLLQGMDL
jgi:hypothetical protein